MCPPIIHNDKITKLCNGYIRINENSNNLITPIPGIILSIVKYAQGRFNPTNYVELKSGGKNQQNQQNQQNEQNENNENNENDGNSKDDEEKKDENSDIGYYLLPKNSIKLSKLLAAQIDDDTPSMEVSQVPSSTLEAVCMYLGHHKSVEPDPLPCPVRSIHMNQICSDPWDAQFIDGFTKKEIFEIILAANYMDIKCLLHLGSAKIATMIKQMDQGEINRIIEEEERYRRQHTAATAATAIPAVPTMPTIPTVPTTANPMPNAFNFGNFNNNNIYGNANNTNTNYWNNTMINNVNNNNQNNNKWNCSACTFENIGINVICEMCFTAKP